MKKILLVVLILGFCLNLSAQNKDFQEQLTDTWFLPYQSDNNKVLNFVKKSFDKYRWGNYITILANGELVVGYSAPCGNDPNIFRELGKWKYNSKRKEFITTISVHKEGKRFTIKSLSENKLVLEKK